MRIRELRKSPGQRTDRGNRLTAGGQFLPLGPNLPSRNGRFPVGNAKGAGSACRHFELDTSHFGASVEKQHPIEESTTAPVQSRDAFAPGASSLRIPDLSTDDSALQLPVRSEQRPRIADLGGETMNPEMILHYRARIAAGVYDRPAIIAALAEAMIESGDI